MGAASVTTGTVACLISNVALPETVHDSPLS